MSSRFFLVTSTDRHILSSGHSFFLAIDCMIAVRNDCGLKKPASHTVVGRAKSVVQESSSWKKKRAAEGRAGEGFELCLPHSSTLAQKQLLSLLYREGAPQGLPWAL